VNVSGHFCTECEKGYGVQRWAGVRDFPDAALEIEFVSPWEAQFAEACKYVKPRRLEFWAVFARGERDSL